MKFVIIGLGYVMYKLLLTLTTIVSCLILPFQTIGQLKSDLNAIGIVVADDDKKQPLSEVLVVLINSTLASQDTVETGNDGNFVFQLKRGQSYRLFASNGKVSSEVNHFETKLNDKDRVFSFFFTLPSPNSPDHKKVIYKSPNAQIADDNMSRIIQHSRTHAPFDLGKVYTNHADNSKTEVAIHKNTARFPSSTLAMDSDKVNKMLPIVHPVPVPNTNNYKTQEEQTHLSVKTKVYSTPPPSNQPVNNSTSTFIESGKSGEPVLSSTIVLKEKTKKITTSEGTERNTDLPQRTQKFTTEGTERNTESAEKSTERRNTESAEKRNTESTESAESAEVRNTEIVEETVKEGTDVVEREKEELVSENTGKGKKAESVKEEEQEEKPNGASNIDTARILTPINNVTPFFLRSDVIVFRVIVGEFSQQLPLDCNFLKEIKSELTIEKSPDGDYQYFAGGPFNDFKLADYYCLRTIQRGYLNAEIYAYRNNQRLDLPMKEILKLKEKEKNR